MTHSPATSYDSLVYDSHAYPQTHPDLLGTLAWLFGIEAAPVHHCRILELGCGTGANLVPYAVGLPESQFLGIDASGRQIELAVEAVRALGLRNIEFRQADILTLDASLGQFDYILCHGVYSWVSDAVQDAILRICFENLKPDGVAYISYNTLPGWHMRGMVREMMAHHDRGHKHRPPQERVVQARALLRFLNQATRSQDSPYSTLLRQELEQLEKTSDSYIFHEHLEEHNEPIYFHQFNERLGKHRLRFLGEADFRTMVHHQLPPEVGLQLTQMLRNLLDMQQYLDFVHNRTFRQSLVCHEHHRPVYGVEPRRVYPLQVFSELRPEGGSADLRPGIPQNFRTPQGLALTSTDPLIKAALGCLAEANPQALPFSELCKQARQRVDPGVVETPEQAEADRAHLGGNLLHMYTVGGTDFVEFWRAFPRFVSKVSEQPVASPLVRWMARKGPLVTSLRHRTMRLEPFDLQVLTLLDGSQSLSNVLQQLLQAFHAGQMQIDRGGQPVRDEFQVRAMLAQRLQEQFQKYAESALLIG